MEEYIKYTKVIELLNQLIKEAKETNSENGIDYDEGILDGLKAFKIRLISANNKDLLGN